MITKGMVTNPHIQLRWQRFNGAAEIDNAKANKLRRTAIRFLEMAWKLKLIKSRDAFYGFNEVDLVLHHLGFANLER